MAGEPPRMPELRFPGVGVVGRESMNRVAERIGEVQLPVCASNEPLRIAYGRCRVGGLILYPVEWGADLLIPFVIARGEIDGIISIELEGNVPGAGVTWTVYPGTPTPIVDPWLQSGWANKGYTYADTLPNIAWGVLRVPPGADQTITGLTVEFRGMKVYDPRVGDNALRFYYTITGGGNGYCYWRINDNSRVVQSGDYLEWEYLVEVGSPLVAGVGGVEVHLQNTPFYGRAVGLVDQSAAATIAPGLPASTGVWHSRRSSLSAIVGNTVLEWLVNGEPDTAGTYSVLYRNIRVTDGAGTTRQTIWAAGAIDSSGVEYADRATNYGITVLAGKQYSTNPVLALSDLISSADYGKGETMDWDSVRVCANAADELVSGSKRREIGIVLDQVRTLDEWEEALRGYAGVWVVREGGVVRFVADAPAASVYAFTNASGSANYLPASMRITQRARRDSPTIVTVTYTDTSVRPWAERQWTEYGPGVLAQTTPWRESVVAMPGIQSASQARRECLRRLNEFLIADVAVEFESIDTAVQLRRGDVVTVTDSGGFGAKQFRIIDHVPLTAGRWRESAVEYATEVYSDAVVTGPGPPNTILPQPNQPTNVTGLTLVEEIYQVQTGLFASRLRAAWTEPAFPFVQYYDVRLTVGQTLIEAATAAKGSTQWVSGPMVENQTYVVTVRTVSTVGAVSSGATASETNDGKLAKPSPPTNLTGYEVGGEVRLEWTPGTDLDLTGHEIRYGSTAGSWGTATLIDRIAAPARRFVTKVVPAGTWRFYVKSLDSVRSTAFPNGQESDTAATADLTVTSDANAFVASAYDFTSPLLLRMSAFADSSGPFWVTDIGDTWNSLFTSSVNSYTNPLFTYHTDAWTGMHTETLDVGASITGDWFGSIGYTQIDGSNSIGLDLNNVGPESAKTISACSNTNPIVLGITGHGYETGNEIEVSGVGGCTAANGLRTVAVQDANNVYLYDLHGVAIAGNGTYTSGGTAKKWVWQSYPSMTAKTTARFVRLWIKSYGGTLLVRKPGNFRCSVVARREGGTVTLPGNPNQPTTVLFGSRYNAAVSAVASAIGAAGHYAMVDKIEVSGARGVQTGRTIRFSNTSGSTGANSNHVTVADDDLHSFVGGTGDLPFTIEFWMRPDSLWGANQTMWGKGGGGATGEWFCRIASSGKFRFALVDDSSAGIMAVDTNVSILPKVWTHIACTYSGSGTNAGMKIYIDGVQQTTFNTNVGGTYTAMENTLHPMVFGNQYNGATYNTPFGGVLDEARLWSTERTAQQILDNMFLELTSGTGLVGRWGFNETSGTTAADSVNSKNGTLTNAITLGCAFRPYDGMDLYRFDASGVQVAGDVSWNFAGV